MLDALPSNTSAADRVSFVSRDTELLFLDSNVHDDARQGIATLSSMEANATIMQSMLSELRVLFGLNVAVSVIVSATLQFTPCHVTLCRPFNRQPHPCTQVLYYSTFLRTVGNVVQQVMPLRVTSPVSIGCCLIITRYRPIVLQARLSRIFLSTIPLDAVSKVCVCGLLSVCCLLD